MKSTKRVALNLMVLSSLGMAFGVVHGDTHIGKETDVKKTTSKKEKQKIKKTLSGLEYEVIVDSQAPRPKPGQRVIVHYTGTLENGLKFDSSLDRNEPFEFVLGQGQVIKGWDEGLALMGKGAKYKLIIPAHLGYGARGAGKDIPPYATLIFEVELLDIK